MDVVTINIFKTLDKFSKNKTHSNLNYFLKNLFAIDVCGEKWCMENLYRGLLRNKKKIKQDFYGY